MGRPEVGSRRCVEMLLLGTEAWVARLQGFRQSKAGEPDVRGYGAWPLRSPEEPWPLPSRCCDLLSRARFVILQAFVWISTAQAKQITFTACSL